MYKFRKLFFQLLTIIYIVLSLIELAKYLFIDSNLFGLIYLIITIVLIFLIIPTMYNYKNNYSNARFSKFVIVVIIGIFNSFVLYPLVVNNMNYIDSSNLYNSSIFLIKNIFKPLLYLCLVLLALRDAKVYEKVYSIKNKNNS